jgi:DNA gyrase subunit A
MSSPDRIFPVSVEDEVKKSYMDYAMSVIIGRALPDARDGLKPVHRRVLYAMHEQKNFHNQPYKKSARTVGDVIAKYHPHGDAAVYDTIVRLAQDFSMRCPLVDGQGNFGSIDGDPPAAMRYTEIRMTALAEELMADIDKDTVDFVPNYDGSEREPVVLPAKFPNLLVNGSAGIAVGMATNIPPHNLREIIDGAIALIDNPELEADDLLQMIPGPDFPTGAFIYGDEGIKSAYRTGKGIIQMRARATTETAKDRESIVVTELPYQSNKARIIEKIAELVKDKRIEGIADVRDESDRDGIRMVIDLKRGENAAVVLNQLYKNTPLQSTFGIIFLALVGHRPKVLPLKDLLTEFIRHRREVVTRRCRFELEKAEHRAHILEGYKIAVQHIDEVVQIIKRSAGPAEAKTALMARFRFTDIQAQSILELRLQRLTQLERDKIEEEYRALIQTIARLKEILANERLLMNVIVEELKDVRERYGDERRTEIVRETSEISAEDMIAEEDMVIAVSHSGYIKRSSVSLYRKQRRGGKGRIGMRTKEQDFVEHLFIASTHNYILVFTESGKVHWLKVHRIPEIGAGSMGKAIVNLLNLPPGEAIAALMPVQAFDEDRYVVMVTRKGIIKKTKLDAFSNPRSGGIIAITCEEGDGLLSAKLSDGSQDIFLGTHGGKSIRFSETDVRDMGRVARGVIGMRLSPGDFLVGMEIFSNGGTILTVTENGYGKRTAISEYRVQHRGGSGLINIKTKGRNGNVVSVQCVSDEDELMVITQQGMILRTPVAAIRQISRNTQGVRLIQLDEGDRVVAATRLAEKEENGQENGSGEGPGGQAPGPEEGNG